MVSRNNIKLLAQTQADKQQRYTIKKLSIGAASVLIGTTLMFGSSLSVKADESVSTNTEQVSDDKTKTDDEITLSDTDNKTNFNVENEQKISNNQQEMQDTKDIVSSDTGEEQVELNNQTQEQSTIESSDVQNSDNTSLNNVTDASEVENNISLEDDLDNNQSNVSFRAVPDAQSNNQNVTLNDGSSVTSDKTELSDSDSTATLNFNSNSFNAGDTYTITIPKLIVNTKPDVSSLPSSLGTSTVTDDGTNWVITNTFNSTGSVSQDIKITSIQKPAMTNEYIPLFNRTEFGTGNYAPNQVLGVDIVVSKNGSDSQTMHLSYKIPDTYKDSINASVNGSVLYNKTPYTFTINYAGALLDSSASLSPNSNGTTAWLNATSKDLTFKLSVPEYFNIDKNHPLRFNSNTTHNSYDLTDYELTQTGTDIFITIKSSSNFFTYPLDKSGLSLQFVGQMDVPDDQLTGASTVFTPKDKSQVSVTFNDNTTQDGSQFMMPSLIIKPITEYDANGDALSVAYKESGNYLGGNGSGVSIKDENGKEIATSGNTAYFVAENTGIENRNDVAITIEYADGLKPVFTWVNWTNKSANVKDIVVHYTDGTTYNTTVNNGEAINFNAGNKIVASVDMVLDKFNPGDSITFGALDYNLSTTYRDGSEMKAGDVLKSKLTMLGNTFEQSDLIYPKQDEKLGLFTYIGLNQTSKVPGELGAKNVNITWRDYSGHKFNMKNPIVFVKLPNNSVYGGNFGATNNYKPKSVEVVETNGIKYLKADFSNYNSITDMLAITFDLYNLFDGQTSTDKLYTFITSSNVDAISGYYNNFNIGKGNGNATIKDLGTLIATNEGIDSTLLVGANDSKDYSLLVSKGVFGSEFSKGNVTNDLALNSDTNSHKGDTFDMYSSVINATDNDLKNVHSFVNIPKNDGVSQFDTELTGPITVIDPMTGNIINGAEVKYSTESVTIDSNVKPDISGFVSADQIRDWNTVKSAVMILPTLVGGMTARMVLPLKDKKIYENVGKSVYLESSTNADGLNPFVIKAGSKASSKVTVVGESTIHVALDIVGENGEVTRIEMPTLDKTYTDVASTMNRSDFPTDLTGIPADVLAKLPANYVIDFDNPTIENSDETYLNGYANETASFDSQVQYYFNGDIVVFVAKKLESVSDTKTVNRTINYVDEQGNKLADSVVQSVEFTRTGLKNPFTGEITWDNWSDDKTVDVVTSPYIENYMTDTKVVDALIIDNTMSDSVVNILYIPQTEEVTETKDITRTINYVYEDGTKASEPSVQTVTFTRTGTKNKVTNEIIWNEWSQSQELPEVISPTKTNYVVDKDTISQINVTHDSNNIEETVTYSPQLEDVSETITKKQIIQYVNQETETLVDSKKYPNNEQSIEFVRTGIKNLVTGQIQWNEWKTLDGQSTIKFNSVTSPNIDGYKLSDSNQEEITGSTITGDSIDNLITVYYSPTSTINVSIINDITGETLSSLSQTDIVDSVSTLDVNTLLTQYLNNGYELVSNDYPENAKLPYDAYPGSVVNYEIHLTEGKDIQTENVSFTRNVAYHKYDYTGKYTDAFTSVSQKVTGTRTVTTNKVTGATTVEYTWDNNKLDIVDVPEIKGYHITELGNTQEILISDIQTIVDNSINTENKYNVVVDTIISYAPNKQVITVNIIIDNVFDNAGNPLTETHSFTGYTDQSFNYDEINNIIKSYDEKSLTQVSNDLPKDLVYDDVSEDNDINGEYDTSQIYNIHYQTQKEQVTENKIVTNTIRYVDETCNQIFDTVNQELTFTRIGEHDLFTNETSWNDWTPEQTFESVTSPEKKGYTANIKVIENVTVNHESPNQGTVVEYIPDIQRVIVNYIDKTTGQTLKTDIKEGPTNTDSQYTTLNTINEYELKGYILDEDKSHQQSIIFDDDTQTDQVYNVYLSHKLEAKSDKLTVNRTINYVDQNGNKVFDSYIDTPITFTRDGLYDYVTKETTWNAWTTDNDTFSQVDSPIKKGYTASQEFVPSQKVTAESSDIDETIVYAPNTQYIIINYIDDVTGETLKTDTITGKTDQQSDYSTTSTITEYENKHYILVSDDTQGKELIFEDATPVYNVHLSHNTEDTIESVTLSDTWNFVYEDGTQAFESLIRDKDVTRTVTTDLVTGEKTYSEPSLKTITFNGFIVPTIDGYTATFNGKLLTNVSDSTIKVDFDNPSHQENNIIYIADTQNIVINFIDETTGTILDSKLFTGKTNTNLDYTTKLDIQNYVNDNYVLISDDTKGESLAFDADTNTDQVYNVILNHKQETVTDSHETKRTINYIYENGTKVFDSIVQGPVMFERTGTKDLVTGITTWNGWSDNQTFDTIISPEKAGYSADIKLVDMLVVTPQTTDSEVTVVYHPTLQSFIVEYIDDLTGKIIHRDSDAGLTGNKSNYSTQSKIDELINKGYMLVSDEYKPVVFTPEINEHVYQVKLTHGKEDVTETKTITRVIKFVDEQGKELSNPETQVVELTRKGTKDKVTGEIIWDNPTSEFAEVSKEIDGYHTDEKALNEFVDFDSENSEVVIHYMKDTSPETPSKETETHIDDNIKSEETTDNQYEKTQIDNKTITEISKPQLTSKIEASKQTSYHETHEQELPQTGDKESNLSILGLSLLGMLGLTGITRKKKKN